MGIIRLLLLIAAVWLVWRLFRQAFLQSPADQPGRAPGTSGTTRMIRCERCGVHVPESEAFMARGHYFCSHEHQAAWLEDNDA